MQATNEMVFVEEKIRSLRRRLDKAADTTGSMCGGEILALSRMLDELIVWYYSLKKKPESR